MAKFRQNWSNYNRRLIQTWHSSLLHKQRQFTVPWFKISAATQPSFACRRILYLSLLYEPTYLLTYFKFIQLASSEEFSQISAVLIVARLSETHFKSHRVNVAQWYFRNSWITKHDNYSRLFLSLKLQFIVCFSSITTTNKNVFANKRLITNLTIDTVAIKTAIPRRRLKHEGGLTFAASSTSFQRRHEWRRRPRRQNEDSARKCFGVGEGVQRQEVLVICRNPLRQTSD